MIDMLLLVVVAAVAWCVAAEGAWGAATTFFCVVFSGLLAMNFFEPLAYWMESQLPSDWGPRADVIALVGLFTFFIFLTRIGTEQLSPTQVEINPLAYQPVRWIFGLLTGYVTMAILLTALHTAPFPREFIGFRPERKNLLEFAAPDRQWLGFTQHVTESVFSKSVIVPGGRSTLMFDGARFQVPGTQKVEYLPTFAIRYATRRANGSVAVSAQAGGGIRATGSGGGGGNSGGGNVGF